MKCILYGTGSGRLRVEDSLKKQHEIIGYSDSFSDYDQFENKPFYKPTELYKVKYDYIIICIGQKDVREEVIKNLKRYNIDPDKVFDFYKFYFHD